MRQALSLGNIRQTGLRPVWDDGDGYGDDAPTTIMPTRADFRLA
jgi:hypothetical protein